MINHSVASAFFVIDLCEKLSELEAISRPLYVAFQLAAEICLIHDMTAADNWMGLDPKYRCKDNEDGSDYFHFIDSKTQEQIPLSMFFILSDELAVWNRAEMKSKHCGNEIVQQTIETGNSSDSFEIKLSYSPKQIAINVSGKNTNTNASLKRIKRSLKKAIGGLKFLCDSLERKNEILGFELKML